MAKHVITVAVAADTRQFGRAMSELGKASGASQMGAAFGGLARVAAAAGAAVGAAAVGIGIKAVGIAGGLQQSIGAVDTVFKESAGQMHGWASSAAESLGLARGSYNELATVLGTQLKNGGTSLDKLGTKTNDLMTLGADLSSMFGGSTSDAVRALSSALKGERDPIERYGVTLKQSAIDAKAAELGFTKVGGALTAQGQQAATLALIMEQTKDAQGNFAKEQNTWQHQLEVGRSKLTNFAGKIGMVLLPALTAAATVIVRNMDPAFAMLTRVVQQQALPALRAFGTWAQANVLPVLRQLGTTARTQLVPALREFGQILVTQVIPGIMATAGWIQRNTSWILPLVAAIAAGVAVWRAWVTAITIWQAVVKVAIAVQAIWNAVMAANPIMLVVILLAALVAAIVVAWRNNETFRRVVTDTWNAVAGAVKSAGRWFLDTCRAIGSAVGSAWSAISGAFSGLPGKFRAWFGDAKTAAVTKLGELVGWVTSLPGKITGALGDLGGLLVGAGRAIMDGLLSGLKESYEKVKGMVSSVAGWISENKGPIDYDRRLLTPHGRAIMAGLVAGLRDAMPDLASMVAAMTGTIADMGTPTIGVLLDGIDSQAATINARAAGGAALAPINLTVQMLDPTPAAARVLVRLLRDAQRAGERL